MTDLLSTHRAGQQAAREAEQDISRAEFVIGYDPNHHSPYWLHERRSDGTFTGRIRNFPLWAMAFEFARRNRYLEEMFK